MSRGTFSTLQHLLKQAYSVEVAEQQQAAIELSNLIENAGHLLSSLVLDLNLRLGTFPAVSFGPLAHALSMLLPSTDRTVATYSARALKALLLDDALRPLAISTGVPAIILEAMNQWEDEVLVLREVLGITQTLCWDARCVRSIVHPDSVGQLIQFVQSHDSEVSVLALASIANVLSFCDTILLTDSANIDALGQGMTILLQILRTVNNRSQRFYAMAAVANACAHPRLQSILKDNDGTHMP